MKDFSKATHFTVNHVIKNATNTFSINPTNLQGEAKKTDRHQSRLNFSHLSFAILLRISTIGGRRKAVNLADI